MTTPDPTGLEARAREIAKASIESWFERANDPRRATRDATSDLEEIIALKVEEALKAARLEGMERAAEIAEAKLGGYLCPYGRDKPGDPTWNHTDEDICPICRVNGHDAALKCHDTASGRIAAAIRQAKGE